MRKWKLALPFTSIIGTIRSVSVHIHMILSSTLPTLAYSIQNMMMKWLLHSRYIWIDFIDKNRRKKTFYHKYKMCFSQTIYT
mgnify:FL=1